MDASANISLVDRIEQSLISHWDLPAFSDYGTKTSFTYGELAEQIYHMHVLLDACGVKKNDKISLIGKNSCNWVITYLGVITYGATIVPILQDFKANDVHHIINHSDSVLLFSTDLIWDNLDPDKLPVVRAAFSLADFRPLYISDSWRDEMVESFEDAVKRDSKHHALLYDMYKNVLKKPSSFNEWLSREGIHKLYKKRFSRLRPKDIFFDKRDDEEIFSISYTSGTTGFSKGVMTSGRSLNGNVRFGISTHLIHDKSRQVSFLPLAHAYGCAFDFMTNVVCGGHTYFISRTPSPKLLLAAFADIKPTCIFSVPLIIEKIYKKQILPMFERGPRSWVLHVPLLDSIVLAQVRKRLVEAMGGEFEQVIIGGAPLNHDVEAFFHRIHFPFTVGYGMTECAPLICYEHWEKFEEFSCGKPLFNMEVRIVDPNDAGIGEIYVRGENVMSGYYKNQEATDAVFTHDGWLKTGDLGMLDEQGNLFIKGRNKTMLLGPSGQNIYPEEIEAKLDNMPYVMESLVLQHDDVLVALVCPDYDALDREHISQDQLLVEMEENRKNLNAMLAAYEGITKIKLYPHEFEKTPKKSIKRYLYTTTFDE